MWIIQNKIEKELILAPSLFLLITTKPKKLF